MKRLLTLLGLLLCVSQARATVFGPAEAIRCPGCKQITLKEYAVLSGNTIGAVLWSDMKFDAPMLPENPALVKCPACGTLLVPREHRCEAPDGDDWIMQAAFTSQCLPSFEEYLSAADQLLDPKTACMLALHARNDPYREQDDDGPDEEPCTETAFIELAERLGALLDTDDPDNRLLRAELFREVGDFDRCIALLDMRSPTGDARDECAAQILAAARKGLTRVFAFE